MESYPAWTRTGTGTVFSPETATDVRPSVTLVTVSFGSGTASAAGTDSTVDPITASARIAARKVRISQPSDDEALL